MLKFSGGEEQKQREEVAAVAEKLKSEIKGLIY